MKQKFICRQCKKEKQEDPKTFKRRWQWINDTI